MRVLKIYLRLAVFLACFVSVWLVMGLLVGPRLQTTATVAIAFALIAVRKLRGVERTSWLDFGLTALFALTVSLLLGNPDWLAGWTLPVMFAIGFAYGLWRLISETRRGDGSPP